MNDVKNQPNTSSDWRDGLMAASSVSGVRSTVDVDAVAVYRALGDDIRLSIVRKLASIGRPVAGCDIVASCASFLELSQPTMSHHFHKLVDAGVVREEKSGTQKIYRLDDTVLQAVGIDSTKV